MAKKTLCKEQNFRGDYNNIFSKTMNFIGINCFSDIGRCEKILINDYEVNIGNYFDELEKDIKKYLIQNKLFISGVNMEKDVIIITATTDIYDLLFVPEIKEEEVTDAKIINKEKHEELISLGEELIKKCSSSNDDIAVCIKKDGSIYHTTNDFSREIYYGDAIVVYTVDNTTTIENIREQIEQASNITKEDFITDQERDKLIEKENYEYAKKYGKFCPDCGSIATNLAPNGAGVMEECNWYCQKCGWEEE
ncbi:hypothetical protein [Clostridium botulinum]|uniref:hypothetical protein n=1 Tax=Clostridium botulinum TaxID=1491 RepID=UPI001F393818|nr:hypothetical protein [Clostridium botulinum]